MIDEFPEYSEDEIKKTMWYNASGVRVGFKGNEYRKDIWRKIKNKLKSECLSKITQLCLLI